MLAKMTAAEEEVMVVEAIRMRAGCSLQKFNLRKMTSTTVADTRGSGGGLYRTTLSSCIAVDSAMNGKVLKRKMITFDLR